MRRRRCNARRLGVVWLLSLGAGRAIGAQTTTRIEGALEFLLPTGARSLAMGQAVAAAAVGSEALWWNPALIARGPREAGLHIGTTNPVIDTDASGAVVVPVRGVGAVAFSVRYLNLGSSPAAGANDTIQTGTLFNTSTIVGMTFAAPFGDRLAAGITAKVLHVGLACTGECGTAGGSSQTSALDLGAQYFVTGDSSLAVGAAIRSLGFKLQIHDTPQADALPSRADVGVLYLPKIAQLPKEAAVRLGADVVSVLGGGTPGYRVGGELSWLNRYQGRVGYVRLGPTAGSGSGPTFGFGLSAGKLQIDFAQTVTDLSGGSGGTPAYLSLRYIF